jgi:predicted MFS family arabinose efflux permease
VPLQIREMQYPRAYPSAVGGLIALAAALGIGRFVYTPILPPMTEALGLGRSAAGMIASANFLGYLMGAVLAAWPRLPGSRRAWLVGCLLLSAVTTAAMGCASTVAPFLLLRLIGGGASAVVLVFASALVLENLAETRRPGLAALHFAGVGTGIVISAMLVAGLQQAGQPWQSLWIANGAVALLAAFAVVPLMREGQAPVQHARRPLAQPLDSRLLRLIVAYGLFGFGYVITATFIVAIVRGTPAIRALEPVIWIVFGLAAAPSVAVWTGIAARLGVPSAFALASVIEAFGVLASVVWPSEFGVSLAAVLVGGTFMGLTALGLIRARALTSGNPRRALALMTAAFGLGQIIGPGLAGELSDRLGGFAVPSGVAAIALLVAAVLVSDCRIFVLRAEQ